MHCFLWEDVSAASLLTSWLVQNVASDPLEEYCGDNPDADECRYKWIELALTVQSQAMQSQAEACQSDGLVSWPSCAASVQEAPL